MKTKLSLSLAVAALSCMMGCSRQTTVDDSVVTMATEATFPPYEYRVNDQFAGVDVDISAAIAKALGKTLKVEDMKFDSVIPAVTTGKADWAAAGITVTEDRKESVDFSIPYYRDAAQVIIVPVSSAIAGADDLKGKKIGVQSGTTGDTFMTQNYGDPERFDNAAIAISAMQAGRVDAVVIDEAPAKNFVADKADLKILETPLTVEEYAIAVRKGNAKLLETINKVIEEMLEKGEIKALMEKHTKATEAAVEPAA